MKRSSGDTQGDDIGIYELRGSIQTYAWGKRGMSSQVAQLMHDKDNVKENVTYAELWMGDHPSGPPSTVIHPDGHTEPLDKHIQKDSQFVLGCEVVKKFGSKLPFLFKVLSIDRSLSVQVHPDKEIAEKLHKERPDIYKDPNHKPELALAVSPMQLLCGFRPEGEIVENLKNFAQLRHVIGESAAKHYISTMEETKSTESDKKEALRSIFKALMTADSSLVELQLSSLLKEIEDQKEKNLLLSTVLRVHSEYPGDVGVFSLFLLNILELEPGSAIFLGPNEPHAYLRGDCIECMATSDNVVRAGLTPKYKDVETLTNILTYKTMVPMFLDGNISKVGEATVKSYIPPVTEFKVRMIELPNGVTITLDPTPSEGASILLVCEGTGNASSKVASDSNNSHSVILSKGTILFVHANQGVTLSASSEHKLVLYQATANL